MHTELEDSRHTLQEFVCIVLTSGYIFLLSGFPSGFQKLIFMQLFSYN